LTASTSDGYDPPVPPRPTRCALAALAALLWAAAAGAAPRFLAEEVVAVVGAHSILLSEVQAEARILLAQQKGASAGELEPDRPLLAATLQAMIDQRLVLTEVESLRTFEVERAEIEGALQALRGRFGAPGPWAAFLRRIELTEEEVGQVLARQIRYARYIDSRVKLAGALRKADVDEQCGKELGPKASPTDLEQCERRLQIERYRKVTEHVIAELRKRIDVRVLDPLEEVG
jgi:hypothetical protein